MKNFPIITFGIIMALMVVSPFAPEANGLIILISFLGCIFTYGYLQEREENKEKLW